MKVDRRGFVTAGLASLGALSHSPLAAAQSNSDAPPAVDGLPCLDFGRSFVCNTASFNAVRFWVESRTVLIDGDRRVEFLQCGSCKSENTFAPKDLFVQDNYDFLPILGDGHWLTFRRTARLNPGYREIRPVEKAWGAPTSKLRYAAKPRVLETWEQMRDATAAAVPLVARTILHNAETKLLAVIEYPIKTMNVSLDKKLYQVDTGPVPFPDLSKRYDKPIDCLQLAFVAFNAPEFADFVIEQPTAVVEEGQERCRIHHFSSPISLPAKNVVVAVEDA